MTGLLLFNMLLAGLVIGYAAGFTVARMLYKRRSDTPRPSQEGK